MKRILALLLAFLLSFSLLACNRDTENKKSEIKENQITDAELPKDEEETKDPPETVNAPLLYKVTDSKGNTAWLFGSIHVGREDYYPLPDYVTNAFDAADSLAVEFDIVAFEKDLKAQISALQALVYTDGTTIADHISAELYEEAVAILKDAGVYNAMLDYYVPALWSSFIDSAQYEKIGADTKLGVDLHFLNRAKEAKKTILDIESAAFQYGMMADFSEELQSLLLEGSVESAKDQETAKQTLVTMMDLWASGDEEAFRAYLQNTDDVEEDQWELYEEYQKAMLFDRNDRMADFTEEALASGDEVFICVGAAHVIGEGALVELMTQRGYTVERITE